MLPLLRLKCPAPVVLKRVLPAIPVKVAAPFKVIVPVKVLTVVILDPVVFPLMARLPVVKMFVAPVVIVILATPATAVAALVMLVAPVTLS